MAEQESHLTIAVVGAGVIGLSCAHDLAKAGHQVVVIHADESHGRVSEVAAAMWFPYRTEESAASLSWSRKGFERFSELANDPDTGVDMVAGLVVERLPASRAWTKALSRYRVADADELPPDALSGTKTVVPVVTTSIYLAWLREECERLGVLFVSATLDSMAAVENLMRSSPDVVVVAAGLQSAALLKDDEESYPIRGQVVRLANPGIAEWTLDDDNPQGVTYIVPRRDDVVCGGSTEVGSWERAYDPELEAAILRRVRALAPALEGQPILSRAVGLRPGRPSVRLEEVSGHPWPVVACYGHGGAGITLSWGSAEEVTSIIEGIGSGGAKGGRSQV